MLFIQHLLQHSVPVRVIPSRLIRFWPWLVASAAIHGLLLAYWLQASVVVPTSMQATDVTIEFIGLNNTQITEPLLEPMTRKAEPVHVSKPRTVIAQQAPAETHQTIEKRTIMIAKKVPDKIQKQLAVMSSARASTPIAKAMSLQRDSLASLKTAPIKSSQAVTSDTLPSQPSHLSLQSVQLDQDRMRLQVRTHLEKFKYYPSSARRRGIEGQVEVAFTLSNKGAANKVSILHGSGYALLDHAALETVNRAQPFPVEDGQYRFRLQFQRL